MTKEKFLQFLRDPEVCKEIFEIVKKGGKPAVSAQTVAAPKVQPSPQPAQQKIPSITGKPTLMFGRGNEAPKQPSPQPQTVTPKVQPTVQAKPKLVVDPSKIPSPPKPEAPKGPMSLADKLKFLRGHLDKVREEEEIAATTKVEEKTPAEKYAVISNRRCPICEKDTRVVKTKSRLNVEKRVVDY